MDQGRILNGLKSILYGVLVFIAVALIVGVLAIIGKIFGILGVYGVIFLCGLFAFGYFSADSVDKEKK